MNAVEALVQSWDEAHWEFTLAFEGLSDDDLWKRPDPRLLSIGELAAHVAHNEADMAEGGTIESPLVSDEFGYYDTQISNPASLPMSVEQVLSEVKRVHEAAKAGLASVTELSEKVPSRPQFTWYQLLQYRVFHVAYHCGQAYSVRHLFGHTTTDN
jgi:uncharacterized damage-inducible protein DinB